MMKRFNANSNGGQFDAETIALVWAKATAVSGNDPAVFRKDRCGAWIKQSEYGTTGKYGWEIDHILPLSKGGTDHLSNLQPLHWENNRRKSDNYPNWECAISAQSQ